MSPPRPAIPAARENDRSPESTPVPHAGFALLAMAVVLVEVVGACWFIARLMPDMSD